MSKCNKWYLLYLKAYRSVHDGAIEAKILDKEFVSELDLLVWASKSMIPKAQGQHFMFGPDGLGRLPTEIYGRIEHLQKIQSDNEIRIQSIAERKERVRKDEAKKARIARKEARCTSPSSM